MTESTDASINPATMFDTWMKSVNNFWTNMATPFTLADDTGKNATTKTSNIDFWKTGMETWQSIASAMSQAAPAPVSLPEIGTFPETFLKMTQPIFSRITQMFQQWQDQSVHSEDYYVKPL